MYTDLLLGTIWFGVNLLLVRSAWGFSRDLFPHDAVLVRVLRTVVVTLALVLEFRKSQSPLVHKALEVPPREGRSRSRNPQAGERSTAEVLAPRDGTATVETP